MPGEPRTEAGKRLLAATPGSPGKRGTLEGILAIEAEAAELAEAEHATFLETAFYGGMRADYISGGGPVQSGAAGPTGDHPPVGFVASAAPSSEAAALDPDTLDRAMAEAGIHVDLGRDPPREVGCKSCKPAIAKILAEYERLRAKAGSAAR